VARFYEKASVQASISGGVVAGLFSLIQPTVGAIHNALTEDRPAISCSQEYKAYAEVEKQVPNAVMEPNDPELDNQCHITKFVKSLHPDAPAPSPAPSGAGQ
jgi:hypothetical protein